QRVNATANPELAAILAHNRDEEKEHASMVLEWLRRQDPVLDRHLRTYLFTSEPVTEVESGGETPAIDAENGSLGIGSPKGAPPWTISCVHTPPSPKPPGKSSRARYNSGSCQPWPPASWWTSRDRWAGLTPPPTWVGSPLSTPQARG